MNLKVLFYLSSSQNEYNTKGKEKNDIKCGVKTPKIIIATPTIYKTRGIPKSCVITVSPKSSSVVPFDTRIPVDREIRREGI